MQTSWCKKIENETLILVAVSWMLEPFAWDLFKCEVLGAFFGPA